MSTALYRWLQDRRHQLMRGSQGPQAVLVTRIRGGSIGRLQCRLCKLVADSAHFRKKSHPAKVGLQLKLLSVTEHREAVRQSGICFNLRPGGGVILITPTGFSRIAKKRRRAAPPFFAYLLIHQFRTLPENFSPRSSQVRSPGQVK